jgi:replicative DNA helicase
MNAPDRPAILFIDYADLIQAESQYKDYRHTLAKIYREVRGLGDEFDIPVWTASQTNREGEDKEIINLKYLAEAYEKAQIADIVITICQNVTDKNSDLLRMYLGKVRNGEAHKLYEFQANYHGNLRFEFLKEAMFNPKTKKLLRGAAEDVDNNV